MTRLECGQPCVRIPANAGNLFILQILRPPLGPTLPTIQCEGGIFSVGVKWPGHHIKHSHLVPRLKTIGVTTALSVCIHIGATSFN